MPECCCARCGKLLAAGAVACPDCAAPTPAAATLAVPDLDRGVTISQLLVRHGAPRAGVQLDMAAGAGRPAPPAALVVEPGQRYAVGFDGVWV